MLSVILGYAQMSMLKVPEGERLWQNLQEICKAAERSGEITRQLLAFSRKEVIAPQPVNLNGLVIEMEKTLGRLIGEDIALSFRQSAGLWTVLIDPSQFHQILINLAVNSRDAMPNGGSIVIETANALVDKALSQRHLEAHCGEYVLLTVRDDGTGIDSGNMEHIFEPFFTTKAVGKGTGLGLATVYGIVTQNHGFIDVDSKLGEGTSFKLYFPRLLEQSLEETKPAERILPGTGSILLVEDDEMVRWSTTQTLEEMGYTVVQAESPQAALEACRNRDLGIDAVLTDIIMPELNGFDLMKQIHAIRPGLKVLFMSGYSSDTIAERGELDVGAGFIQKPFTIYSLNLKLRALFEDRPKHHS